MIRPFSITLIRKLIREGILMDSLEDGLRILSSPALYMLGIKSLKLKIIPRPLESHIFMALSLDRET